MDPIALYETYPALAVCRAEIDAARASLIAAFRAGGKLLVCGNGGSAADCGHIVGELMKAFRLKRPLPDSVKTALRAQGDDGAKLADGLEAGLPAIDLTTHAPLLTAFANDRDAEMVYAQEVLGYGRAGDLLLCLSTSGNAKNCVYAARAARAARIPVIAITGRAGGVLGGLADVCVRLPADETYRVQEYTLPVYHYLCAEVERAFFGEAR